MSYTSSQNKSKSFSKYIYSSLNNVENLILFDIQLLSKKKSKKIKKVKNVKTGYLFNIEDKINKKYNNINIEIIFINTQNKNINFNIDLLPLNTSQTIIYQNSSIYVEVSKNFGFLKFFYNLL